MGLYNRLCKRFFAAVVVRLTAQADSREQQPVAAPKCQPSEDEPPDHDTGKKKVFYKWNTW